jgi:hypothetical protein
MTLRLRLTAAVLTLALAACGGDDGGLDPNDPDNPNALGLAVGVRVEPATFPGTGEFTLELVPSTPSGQSLVAEEWETSTSITAPASLAATLLSQELFVGDTRPFTMAIDVDNSGSMSRNDPDGMRLEAAAFFAGDFLSRDPAHRLGLFEMGPSATSTPPETDGFPGTRMILGWTADAPGTEAAVGQLSAYPDAVGGTQIYRSLERIGTWIDTTTSPVDVRRGVLLITDGRPYDGSVKEEFLAVAAATETRVYTVGLGPGSDRGDDTDPLAVQELQSIANATGGLYVGAATPERLTSLLQALATSTSGGVILARFQLDPVPAPGTVVTGRVRMENQRGIAQAPWSFVAP